MIIVVSFIMLFQAESRYREQLKAINVTVASRTFQTDEDPIETEDLFVSVVIATVTIILLLLYILCLLTLDNIIDEPITVNSSHYIKLIRLKVKIIVCLC